MFRLTTTEPPSAPSGTYYKTVEERCAACVVKGGQEGKCVSKEYEEAHILAGTGKVCPRVELPAALEPDVEIIQFLIGENKANRLSTLRAECVADVYGLTTEELNETLSRVHETLGRPELARLVNPPKEV